MPVLDPCVPVVAPRANPGQGGVSLLTRDYVGRMHPPARQVAAVLAGEIPHLDSERLHRLLYYVQGHHLALRGRPAFAEAVMAGPDGPYVLGEVDPESTAETCPGSQANVALMVAARYGGLTGGDLKRLTMAEQPWQATALNAEIPPDLMAAFFTGPGAQQHADRYPPMVVARLREGVTAARAAARTQTPAPALTAAETIAAIGAKAGGDDRRR
jgi:uncharacterized phage-associated protein